ncbi:MAG: pyrroline-5-carboxylate reductase [Candidatus Poribacteria bacterium]|nr:pyrroline-5-carboxylate reductase [Candidatus Poribacteria bacterium]MDE0313507.1 pyrroline-5-carboxylate reductase [Candidatus Poribacteria bacterium]
MVVDNQKLGVIGVGKMGGIIVRSIVDRLLPAQQICITDLDKNLVTQLCDEKGVNAASDIDELIQETDVILCAVPPVAVPHIVPQVAHNLSPPQWIVSIAAGVTTETLESYFETPPPIVRVMPNIAASVEAAISVLTAGSTTEVEHLNFTKKLFDTCGTTLIMEERHLNAVTAVSGSGPAYVALFVEAIADAGVHVGLPRQDAQTLAIHTVLGAATMLSHSQDHPAVLKNRVTTPGGTTAAGLHALERGGLRATLAEAILAATERAKQLDTAK